MNRNYGFEALEARRCLATTVMAHSHNASQGSAIAAEIDGDGTTDLVLASYSGVTWHRNADGRGNFVLAQQVTQNAVPVVMPPVAVADLDNDQDNDIVTIFSTAEDNQLAWFENVDGQFEDPHVIATTLPHHQFVIVADWDGDGDPDVLAGSAPTAADLGQATQIAWYESAPSNDGSTVFLSQPHLVTSPPTQGVRDAAAADVDNDGDTDLLLTTLEPPILYENASGDGQFAPPDGNLPGMGLIMSVVAADLNQDQIPDLLTGGTDQRQRDDGSFAGVGVVAWSINDSGAYPTTHEIITTFRVYQVLAADMDGDRDNDVIAVGLDRIAWFANTDGQGTLGEEQEIGPNVAGFPFQVDTGDVDGDGDLDIVAADRWFQFESDRLVGDSNGDGVFNSDDLIQVLAAGEYEDDIPGNSTFEEGDWDGDGDFTTDDLLFALASGNYTT